MTSSRATGDDTGYGLTVKKNYESYTQKLKDLAKKNPGNREEKNRTKKAYVIAG
jgi:transposase